MKLTNNLINKLGVDRVLHYTVGGWFTSLAIPFGIWYVLAFALIIIILNFFKEKYLDEEFDKIDLKWCIYGTLTSLLYFGLLFLLGLVC